MRGNNCERQRHRVEDTVIRQIDGGSRNKKRRSCFKVPIIEIIAYKAAKTGRAIRLGSLMGGQAN